MFGFSGAGIYTETLPKVSPDRKIRWSPKPCFADPHAANPRQRKGSQFSSIQVQPKQIPKILDTAQVIGLDMATLVTAGSRLFVIKTHLDLPEHSVAQLFKQMNIGNGPPSAPE